MRPLGSNLEDWTPLPKLTAKGGRTREERLAKLRETQAYLAENWRELLGDPNQRVSTGDLSGLRARLLAARRYRGCGKTPCDQAQYEDPDYGF